MRSRIRSFAPSRSESTSDSTQTTSSIALVKSNCALVAPSSNCSQDGGDCAAAGAASDKNAATTAGAAKRFRMLVKPPVCGRTSPRSRYGEASA